jgi:spore coat protein JB
MNNQNNQRERLMKQMQIYSFALYETQLYLDAYPDSREALMAYNKYSKLAARAKMEYEQKFGPVTPPNEASSWTWTQGPWPWQL